MDFKISIQQLVECTMEDDAIFGNDCEIHL